MCDKLHRLCVLSSRFNPKLCCLRKSRRWQCVRRFKELATAIRERQQAAAVVQAPAKLSMQAAADEDEVRVRCY